MAQYSFVTQWDVHASLGDTWRLIENVKEWSSWWRGVLEVKEIKDDHRTLFAHTWRSFLPYRLKFVTEITEIKEFNSITAMVSGELKGTGRWKFQREGNVTKVTYYWDVRTTLAWMNVTAPLLKGVFRWNHDTVMRWGGEGLARQLNCKVVFRSYHLADDGIH